jgi:hypothetical protein
MKGEVMQQFTKRMDSRFVFVGALSGMIVTAAALLVLFGYASAGGAAVAPAEYQYQGPPEDVVTGSGTVVDLAANLREQFIVSAHSGPLGEDPRGQVVLHSPLIDGGTAKGEVTCMIVTGNRAQVGGVFESPVLYDGQLFHWFEWIIDDNGPPGQGLPDAISPFIFLSATHPPDFNPCTVFLAPAFPLDEGNFTVKDSSGP